MLTCPKCGYDNELGRIFCHQCGTKLDLDQIKPPSRGGKPLQQKRSMGLGKAISWLVRLVIFGGLILVLFLIAQVPQLTELKTTPHDLESFGRKRANLETAVATRKPAAVSLSSAELNAFLGKPEFEDAQGSGIKVQPVTIQVDLEDGRFTAHFIGKIKAGASFEKAIALSYTAVPKLDGGRLTFEPVAAQIGKLTVPKFILEHTNFVQGYFAQLFHKLDVEKELLQSLTSISIEPGDVLLEYKPEAKP